MVNRAVVALAALISCQDSAATVPRVELSALAAKPKEFNGKEVLVSGLVHIEEGRYIVVATGRPGTGSELMYLAIDRTLLQDPDELTTKVP